MTSPDDWLIEQLAQKHDQNDTTNFKVLDFVAAFGSPLDAVMYTRLFWPEFVEIDDMILLGSVIESEEDKHNLRNTLRNYNGDRCKTERDFNFIEIPSHVFSSYRIAECTESLSYYLVTVISEMWASRLHMTYPDRRFSVCVLSPEDTGGEYGIVFHQGEQQRCQ